MRLKTLAACAGIVAVMGVPVAAATSTNPGNGQVSALKHVAVSWGTYAAAGSARKACRLQVEQNVSGIPCDQLPSYAEPIYCPADPGPTDSPPRWRTGKELVGKVKVAGRSGTAVLRASDKRSKRTGQASFRKVDGKWRISSFRLSGQIFTPAGLIFTDGNLLRKELWPAHC
jgi:hypothetical protein